MEVEAILRGQKDKMYVVEWNRRWRKRWRWSRMRKLMRRERGRLT